jgi:hypothetical protein
VDDRFARGLIDTKPVSESKFLHHKKRLLVYYRRRGQAGSAAALRIKLAAFPPQLDYDGSEYRNHLRKEAHKFITSCGKQELKGRGREPRPIA